jgi:methylglutaconyl-CoA hydratase
MSDDCTTIRIERDPPLAWIVLDRPGVRNAISRTMVDELLRALDELEGDEEVRVVLLRGEGNVFCAGADLEELRAVQQTSPRENLAAGRQLGRLYHRLYTFPKATVAAVHGPCVAGGCGLATGCDLTVADETAVFRYSEASIGFVAALVGVILVRAVGEKRARDLLLTARPVSAGEAFRLGLVTESVAAGGHLERARELAGLLASNSLSSIRLSKELLAALPALGLEAAFEQAARVNAEARQTEDCREGVAAFLEKRLPSWRKE